MHQDDGAPEPLENDRNDQNDKDGEDDEPLDQELRDLVHRWFVRYNPLYFFSAASMLLGVYLVSRGLDEIGWRPGKLDGSRGRCGAGRPGVGHGPAAVVCGNGRGALHSGMDRRLARRLPARAGVVAELSGARRPGPHGLASTVAGGAPAPASRTPPASETPSRSRCVGLGDGVSGRRFHRPGRRSRRQLESTSPQWRVGRAGIYDERYSVISAGWMVGPRRVNRRVAP